VPSGEAGKSGATVVGMQVDALADVTLKDATGTPRRLGDYWAEKPVVVVFLRHFGCLLCREHIALVRDRYDEIQGVGGEVIAIGTGSVRYAANFIEEEHVTFPVLVDDDGVAASAAQVPSLNFFKLVLNRKSWAGTKRAHAAGHKVHKAGKRVTQLGATFVLGSGDRARYEHIDEHSADHAPLEDVIKALQD
jgi:peroxiredoxin